MIWCGKEKKNVLTLSWKAHVKKSGNEVRDWLVKWMAMKRKKEGFLDIELKSSSLWNEWIYHSN